MSTTITYNCDICNKKADHRELEIQVVFTTEQNEGRATKPYLDIVKMDICKYCLQEITSGKPVFAAGAMGHNEYRIPNPI